MNDVGLQCTVKLYKKPGALQFNLHLKFDLLKDRIHVQTCRGYVEMRCFGCLTVDKKFGSMTCVILLHFLTNNETF